METFYIFIITIVILYFISKRFTKKEENKFYETDDSPKQSSDLLNIDHINDIVVSFVYLQKGDQFMMTSKPNLVINDVERYKIENNEIILKLNPKFKYHFGVPYMGGESFKITEELSLEPGYHYSITFKPKVFIYQKPKVEVTKIKPLNPVVPTEDYDF